MLLFADWGRFAVVVRDAGDVQGRGPPVCSAYFIAFIYRHGERGGRGCSGIVDIAHVKGLA